MENKIPSAEEFLDQHKTIISDYSYSEGCHIYSIYDVERLLKEFAKLHVKQAAQAIYNAGLDDITSWDGNRYTGEGKDYLDLNKILNAYPEDNIQ